MPKPDKTKLRNGILIHLNNMKQKGSAYENLSELPESVKQIIDVENSENLVIQHNNDLAYSQVSDQAKKMVSLLKVYQKHW